MVTLEICEFNVPPLLTSPLKLIPFRSASLSFLVPATATSFVQVSASSLHPRAHLPFSCCTGRPRDRDRLQAVGSRARKRRIAFSSCESLRRTRLVSASFPPRFFLRADCRYFSFSSLISFAKVAHLFHYTRPLMTEENSIVITKGRFV